jgi:ribosomal protein L20
MHVLQHRYLKERYKVNFRTKWVRRIITMERIEKVESGRYIRGGFMMEIKLVYKIKLIYLVINVL